MIKTILTSIAVVFLLPFSVGLYKAYKRQNFILPDYYQFVWLRHFGGPEGMTFPKHPGNGKTPTVYVTQEVMDMFVTHQVLNINKKLWIDRDSVFKMFNDMNKDLFDLANKAEQELRTSTKMLNEMSADWKAKKLEVELQETTIKLLQERKEALDRQIADNNESLIVKNDTIAQLKAELATSEQIVEDLKRFLKQEKGIEVQRTTVDVGDNLTRLLDGIETAQGALLAHIMPQSTVTAEETVSALLGILDDQDFVVSQRAMNDIMEREHPNMPDRDRSGVSNKVPEYEVKETEDSTN